MGTKVIVRPQRWLPLLCALTLSAWVVGHAHAMHPADFPHQHGAQVAPEPEKLAPPPAELPQHAPEAWNYVQRYYGALGGLGGAVLANGSQLAEGLGEGGGLELLVGWRLNRWVALDIAWAMSFHATQGDEGFEVASAVLSSFTGWVRVYLAPPGRFEPYVGVGASLVTANGGPQSSISLMGFGGSAALGLDIHLDDWLTLGIKASHLTTFLDNQAGRLDHLPDYPAEAAFVHMLSGSAHLRFNF